MKPSPLRLLAPLLAGTLPLCLPLPAPAETPTFANPIAGIIYNQCTPCHRPGGGAPFSLLTHEEVKKRARMIAEVTASGYMPPWKIVASDLKFANERRLPPDQQALLAAWIAAGAPLGDPDSLPPPPQFPTEWHHGPPDLLLEMEEDMPIPASGTDIYRAFVVRIPDLPPGKYLKGLEYKPRAITTAHHTLFSIDATGRARQQAEAQPGPGLRTGGGSGAMGRIAGWAVGAVPAFFPEGAAIEIPPGSDLVLASHFHPTGKPETERAQIALYLTDDPPRRYLNTVDVPFMFGALKDIRIPPGDPAYTVREQYTLPVDMRLASLAPHAHYLAKTMHATATLPDGRRLTLLAINDWDFAWQEQYELAEELFLPKGTRIDMQFTYDNTAQNPRNPNNPPKEVTWGLQSTDEMASITLGLITDTKEDRAEMWRAYLAWVKNDIEKADPRITLASLSAMRKDRFDLDGDGQVSWRETGNAIGQIYQRITAARRMPAGADPAADLRAQILPAILRRAFRLIVLPWLLPRLLIAALLIAILAIALRHWRASRRRRTAPPLAESGPAPENT